MNTNPVLTSRRSAPRNSAIVSKLAIAEFDDQHRFAINDISLSPVASSDLLLHKFLSYFSQDQGGRTWHEKLPRLNMAKNKIALKAAVRAVALAYAAQNVSDPSMAHAARGYYGNSLRYHQYSFKAPPGKALCKAKAFNAVPVTVLLSYFEMMQATSADAWLKHTLAAERLFALLDESALQDELLNHLYFIVRANAAVRCFLLGGQTELAERRWSETGFIQPCGRNTASFHSVVDIIMKLARYVNVSMLSSGRIGQEVDADWAITVLHDLNQYWQTFAATIGLSTSSFPLLNSSEAILISSFELPTELQEQSSALAAAFFSAAVILTCTLFDKQGVVRQGHGKKEGLSDPMVVRSNIQYHCSQILGITGYLRWTCVGCSCVRMLLPLVVVNQTSSMIEQRLLAEKVFLEWSRQDGLPGLGLFAFGTDAKEIPSSSS